MFRTWIGASAADAIVRLAAQMASTIVVARILSPAEFGISTLVLGLVTIMATFIGLPFEEALSQRRSLNIRHLETVLFVSFGLSCVAVLLALVLGPWIGILADAPGFGEYLLVGTLLLMGQGPGTVAKAMARRSRRFVEIAFCQGASTVIASAVAVLAALSGWGVYALLLQRLLPNAIYPVLTALILAWRGQRIWIRMRWHRRSFQDLFRFSWLHLADVGVTAVAPAVLAFMVNAFFGGAVLGQINIALRIVDPLRMAILGGGHNLAFSVLVGLQTDPRALIAKAGDIAAGVAALTVPAFVGLAVSAPVLLPLLVGPGWQEAVPLARILCLAVALSLPCRFYFTAFSALGRPENGVIGSVAGLICMITGFFVLTVPFGVYTAATSFLIYEVAAVTTVLFLGARLASGTIAPAILLLARVWLAALVMALAVLTVQYAARPLPITIPSLMLLIVTGAVTYPIALVITCKSCLQRLKSLSSRGKA